MLAARLFMEDHSGGQFRGQNGARAGQWVPVAAGDSQCQGWSETIRTLQGRPGGSWYGEGLRFAHRVISQVTGLSHHWADRVWVLLLATGGNEGARSRAGGVVTFFDSAVSEP